MIAAKKMTRRTMSPLILKRQSALLYSDPRRINPSHIRRDQDSWYLRKMLHQFETVLAVTIVVFELVHVGAHQRPSLPADFKLFDCVGFIVVGVDC